MTIDPANLSARLARLPAPAGAAGLPLPADELAAARRFADASRAPATRRAYASDWAAFTNWCDARSLSSMPAAPAVVALYLAGEGAAGRAPATVNRRRAAIGYFHRRAGFQPPRQMDEGGAIDEVVAGIRRTCGVAPRRKRPSTAPLMQEMLATIEGDGVRAARDRALLALGLSGAFRRSELAALQLGDLEMTPDGLKVTIRRSKGDQEGAGAVIAIPDGRHLRPKALLVAWLAAGAIEAGPVFRRLTRRDEVTDEAISDRFVARLVQRCAAAAGYRPEDFGGHSLRSGFLTEAARRGASIFKMREVSRHKSMQVLADYVRDAELFENHAGEHFL